MRRCEDEKMRYRPPLLEEPCAQTLSGKSSSMSMKSPMLKPLTNNVEFESDANGGVDVLYVDDCGTGSKL